FYLTGLYNDISEETAGIISFCIEEADGEELQNRLTAISAMSNGEPATITVEKSVEGNGSNVSDMKKGKGAVVFSLLVKEVRQTVHHAVDTVMPPNLPMLDSLIAAGFRNKNISARLYYSEIIDMNTGNVIAASRRQEAGMKGNAFVYEYDTENGYAYKIHTSSMTLAALERMSGILLTTLLTALLLGYAFRFFIRTAVRQKTLEEMKQDFTNNMTHELKTPVSIAYSAVDALLNFRQGESAEKRRQYLNICIEQLSRLRDLIEQILSASMERSKNIVLKKENVALKPLFARIAEQQKLNIDKCVDIDILVQPENLTVYADATHLYNIVANLTDNA
ncbi:MAG: HAMP domain-containing histidine kinase, partial [Tannerellaceae bacterium]|nr:HAMP domain-containing histidine kinase [Tannerellaceae bacterium]